jgi:hypothetical protein
VPALNNPSPAHDSKRLFAEVLIRSEDVAFLAATLLWMRLFGLPELGD